MAVAAPRVRKTPELRQTTAPPVRPDPLDLRGERDLALDLLGPLVDLVQQRRQRNLDTYIACTGREGWGKSALGLQAALALDPSLSPDEVIFDLEDYYQVYDPDAKDQVYVFDEAGRLLFNRNWNRSEQVALVQEVMENRKNRNVIFLHLPQFKSLDKYAREGRIFLRFACTQQGRAMVRRLKYNSYTEEAYYPVVIQDHRWLPLEATHPEFAERYYERKDDRHASKFHDRKRRVLAKKEEREANEAKSTAQRDLIMAKKEES